MKIYILPLNDIVKPAHGFIAPAHNSDYGIENDWPIWLQSHPEMITDNPAEADWDYFGAYFNRYYCQYWGDKWEVLQDEILRTVSRNRPTFTLVEYDITTLQPQLDLCNMTIFTASRNGDKGIDIPLLCSPHTIIKEWNGNNTRRWLASFMGKFMIKELEEC